MYGAVKEDLKYKRLRYKADMYYSDKIVLFNAVQRALVGRDNLKLVKQVTKYILYSPE